MRNRVCAGTDWTSNTGFPRVFPADSARVAVGENIHLPYHGHCALLYSPQVLRRVVQCLDQPEPAA